jgi:hypothetical protein
MLDPRAKLGDIQIRRSQAFTGASPKEKRQPQERQHSAASWRDAGPTAVARPIDKAPERGTVIATPECNDGGARGRVPPASDTLATSRLVGINFAFVISSRRCACRCTTCAQLQSQLFQRTTWQRKRRRQRRARKLPRRWQRRRRGKSNDEKVPLRIEIRT